MKPQTIAAIAVGLQYAPYVLQAAQQLQVTNADMPGATKKAILLASVTAASKVGETVPEAHVALISMLVDLIVGIAFPHPPAPAAPALTVVPKS